MIQLYDYYRSTASYRVRMALYLKDLAFESKSIHLVNNGGEQHSASYKEINPQELVPTIEINNIKISQSIAIMEYLEESYPKINILPKDALEKARCRMLSQIIACDIHPLNNLRVLQYLENEFSVNQESKLKWYHNWLKQGFDAIENWLKKWDNPTAFSINNSISMADICLISQAYNAARFNFSLVGYPKVSAIVDNCSTIEEIKAAHPDNFKD